MQDSSQQTPNAADSAQLLKRIDQLESLLRGRQRALGEQMDALQARLARSGLDTADKIGEAFDQLEASHRDALLRQLRPVATTEPALRAMARRRMGRMV